MEYSVASKWETRMVLGKDKLFSRIMQPHTLPGAFEKSKIWLRSPVGQRRM